MGARTDAARAEVVAARGDLSSELDGLVAATRASLDIPGKVRRSPARAAAIGAGAAFLILGGPGRTVRRVRRALFGAEPAMPKALLPEEVERVVRSLGSDGDAVRGALERDFARYLDERGSFAGRDIRRAAGETLAGLIRLGGRIVGFRLASRLLSGEFGERAGGGGGAGGAGGLAQLLRMMPTRRPRIFRRPF